jgi:hypothetical protein
MSALHELVELFEFVTVDELVALVVPPRFVELVMLVELEEFTELDTLEDVLESTELVEPAAAMLSAEPHAHSPSATTVTRYLMASPPMVRRVSLQQIPCRNRFVCALISS